MPDLTPPSPTPSIYDDPAIIAAERRLDESARSRGKRSGLLDRLTRDLECRRAETPPEGSPRAP
jgi:hypothetical protein